MLEQILLSIAAEGELCLLVSSAVAAVLLLLRMRGREKPAAPIETKLGAATPEAVRVEELGPSQPVESEAEKVTPQATVVPIAEKSEPKRTGLEKSRQSLLGKLKALFGSQKTEDWSQHLEELLISSDLGVQTSRHLVSLALEEIKNSNQLSEEAFLEICRRDIGAILTDSREREIHPGDQRPYVVAFVGVNGVGKTTTLGKLSNQLAQRGFKVLAAACDTFRAGAVDQLGLWAERAGIELLSGAEGEKPSTVAYRAVNKAKAENFDVLLIDTAGRLHTRVNLMNELSAVMELVKRELGREVDECILVVDGSTGQNALQQAREFNERAKLSGLIVTKLDGTSKGGIVVAIKRELGIPIRYIGVGEGIADLKPFDVTEFVDALFTPGDDIVAESNEVSAKGQVRRKRRG